MTLNEEDQRVPVTTPSPVSLRDYQMEAVSLVLDEENRVRASGVIEMDCGLGKTYVGGEIIHRMGGISLVVTQHTSSVAQWVRHLRNEVGIRNVMTHDTPWTVRDPFPDVCVLTYASMVSVASAMELHDECLKTGEFPPVYGTAPSHLVVWFLRLLPLKVLILDEAHMAVAEQFSVACDLNACVAVGLSGSLVREDARLGHLMQLVGPVLFCFHAQRDVLYTLVTVPLLDPVPGVDANAAEGHVARNPRSKHMQVMRTLNPNRIAILLDIISNSSPADSGIARTIVFCDSRPAAQLLASTFGFYLLHGGVAASTRERILSAFAEMGGVLVTTKVCDAAIDFPTGCRVVQLFSVSGSRQQEMQRCGRGWRGALDTSSHVVHIVAENTEEVSFAHRRLRHMQSEFGDCVKVKEVHRAPPSPLQEEAFLPLRAFFATQSTSIRQESSGGNKSKVSQRKRPRLL